MLMLMKLVVVLFVAVVVSGIALLKDFARRQANVNYKGKHTKIKIAIFSISVVLFILDIIVIEILVA